MKTGIFITARLGSTRLQQKHMLEVNGVPILSYLIKRINTEFKEEIEGGTVKVFICTAKETMNERFQDLNDVAVIYGSIHNIPLRHYEAAIESEMDQIIAVDGDDILCSTAAMRSVMKALDGGARYVYTQNLPFGMNCFGYKKVFLKDSVEKIKDLAVLETGWTRVFDEGEKTAIAFDEKEPPHFLRFTLDYQEDFDFFCEVLRLLDDRIECASDTEIIELVLREKLYLKNSSISEEYWRNFNAQVKNEKKEVSINV